MKGLLFFLANAEHSTSMPVAATLAWLAKEKGIHFDAYFAGRSIPEVNLRFFPEKQRGFFREHLRPEEIGLGYMGGIAPFQDSHAVDVYSILSHYEVVACTNAEGVRRFIGSLKSLGERFVSARKEGEVAGLYLGMFSYFDVKLPEKAVMVPSTPFHLENRLLIESYCYPDIFFSKLLGLDTSVSEEELGELKKMGLKEIRILYCPENTASKLEKQGFETKIIDKLRPRDTYGTVTKRIFDRWKETAKGVAYGDPNLTMCWTPFFCHNNLISLFDFDWENFALTVAACADETNSTVIWGRQLSDHFIPLLSKHDKILAIIDAGRPPITIKREIPYRPAPLVDTPWSREISRDELIKKASKGGIPATILMYASDVRHMPVASTLFSLASLMRIKIGVAFPVNWYEYIPEWMDDVYTPYEVGGSMPYVEPMICTAGLGVATEAKEYLSDSTLTQSLIKTREWISNHWGEGFVPLGYYPFQDACPFYKHDTAEPQFEAVRSAGFLYYVTYKDEGKLPKVVYEKDDFIAVNQQTLHWAKDPLEDLRNWEEKIANQEKPGWIIVSIDSPFWGFMLHKMTKGKTLIDAMNFIKKGGKSGRLFSATPHEITRYARIIAEQSL